MTEHELIEQRRRLWRTGDPGQAVRTLEDARGFLNSVGFCLFYPIFPPVLAPTWLGAYYGGEQRVPRHRQAFSDPRVKDATDLLVRLLREKSAFEAAYGDLDTSLVFSAAEFPFFYALVGDKNPRKPPSPGERRERQLWTMLFEVIQQHGPLPKRRLNEHLGQDISELALDRALHGLWSDLRIARVDYDENGGVVWDVIYRFAPEALKQALEYSRVEALSGLISRYLETSVAATRAEVEEFFLPVVAKSKIADVIKALTGAREYSFISIGEKNYLRIAAHDAEEAAGPRVREARAPRPPRAVKPKKLTIRAMKGIAPAGKIPRPEHSDEQSQWAATDPHDLQPGQADDTGFVQISSTAREAAPQDPSSAPPRGFAIHSADRRPPQRGRPAERGFTERVGGERPYKSRSTPRPDSKPVNRPGPGPHFQPAQEGEGSSTRAEFRRRDKPQRFTGSPADKCGNRSGGQRGDHHGDRPQSAGRSAKRDSAGGFSGSGRLGRPSGKPFGKKRFGDKRPFAPRPYGARDEGAPGREGGRGREATGREGRPAFGGPRRSAQDAPRPAFKRGPRGDSGDRPFKRPFKSDRPYLSVPKTERPREPGSGPSESQRPAFAGSGLGPGSGPRPYNRAFEDGARRRKPGSAGPKRDFRDRNSSRGPRGNDRGPRSSFGPRNDRPRSVRSRNLDPSNSRPRKNGPRDARPRADRPRADRQRADRPRDDRPKSFGQKAFGDRKPFAGAKRSGGFSGGDERNAVNRPGAAGYAAPRAGGDQRRGGPGSGFKSGGSKSRGARFGRAGGAGGGKDRDPRKGPGRPR